MLSGLVAAQVIIDSVVEKNTALVRTYDERIEKVIVKELQVAWSIANIIYKSKGNADMICEIVRDDAVLRNAVINLLTGFKPYSQMKREIIKRLIKAHPMKAVRLRIGI
jgi:flavin-dependent dehydrogenase